MSLLTPLFWIALVLPFFIWATISSKSVNIKFVLLFIVYFLADAYLQFLGHSFFDLKKYGFKFNWIGKLLSLALSFGILFSVSKDERNKIGASNYFLKTTKFGIIIFLCFLAFDFIFKLILFPKGSHFDLETFCFQAVMPGISEEMVFRGIGLWLLSRAFPQKWNWNGVSFGWDFILVTLLFGIGHGAIIDENLKIKFDFITILYLTLIGSLSLGFLRKFSGNLIAPIIGHNVINLMNAIIRIL